MPKHMPRWFPTKEEVVRQLEEYLKQLKEEAQEIEEQISEFQKAK